MKQASMFKLIRERLERLSGAMSAKACYFDRPLVLLHSDDWGRGGIPDRPGYNRLKEDGVELGGAPYDFYSLETAEDVYTVSRFLLSHRDSIGRSPSIIANFVVSNVDFDRTIEADFRKLHLMPLAEGLPSHWLRPGLRESYRRAVADGAFCPGLHGATHFCWRAVEELLRSADQRGHELRRFYKLRTPYLYHQMPWIGFEYWDNRHLREPRFLDAEAQSALITGAVAHFENLFGFRPKSACAPGYRANEDTQRAWASHGIEMAHNKSKKLVPPYVDLAGLLHISRNVDFEPALDSSKNHVEEALQQCEACFSAGVPAVISIHAINFHSSLRNFRDATIDRLDSFLTRLEQRHGELLYLSDCDLANLVKTGCYGHNGTELSVRPKQASFVSLGRPGIFRRRFASVQRQVG